MVEDAKSNNKKKQQNLGVTYPKEWGVKTLSYLLTKELQQQPAYKQRAYVS